MVRLHVAATLDARNMSTPSSFWAVPTAEAVHLQEPMIGSSGGSRAKVPYVKGTRGASLDCLSDTETIDSLKSAKFDGATPPLPPLLILYASQPGDIQDALCSEEDVS